MTLGINLTPKQAEKALRMLRKIDDGKYKNIVNAGTATALNLEIPKWVADELKEGLKNYPLICNQGMFGYNLNLSAKLGVWLMTTNEVLRRRQVVMAYLNPLTRMFVEVAEDE